MTASYRLSLMECPALSWSTHQHVQPPQVSTNTNQKTPNPQSSFRSELATLGIHLDMAIYSFPFLDQNASRAPSKPSPMNIEKSPKSMPSTALIHMVKTTPTTRPAYTTQKTDSYPKNLRNIQKCGYTRAVLWGLAPIRTEAKWPWEQWSIAASRSLCVRNSFVSSSYPSRDSRVILCLEEDGNFP